MTYIWPSNCEQCIPVENNEADHLVRRVIHKSHQIDCPNHPEATRHALIQAIGSTGRTPQSTRARAR